MFAPLSPVMSGSVESSVDMTRVGGGEESKLRMARRADAKKGVEGS